MDTKNLIKHICSSLDTRKAEDILVLDMQSVSSIADYFIIASADSERAVKSLAENLVREVKKEFKTLGIHTTFGDAAELQPFLDNMLERVTPLVAKARGR